MILDVAILNKKLNGNAIERHIYLLNLEKRVKIHFTVLLLISIIFIAHEVKAHQRRN